MSTSTFRCSQGHRFEAAAAADARCPECGSTDRALPEPPGQVSWDEALAARPAQEVTVTTGPDGAWSEPALAKVRVAGYEILGELGRGGMGWSKRRGMSA